MDSKPVRKKVFYPFLHMDRVGEIADQMFCLRNLYPVVDYDLHIITHDPRQVKIANQAVFDIATRGMHVAVPKDSSLVGCCYNTPEYNRIITDGDSIYVMLMHSQLKARLLENRAGKTQYDYFSLSDKELALGQALRAEFNIPSSARIVCLYVRDGSYFSNDYQSSYRNADICNYIPAVNYLLNEGFYVVRIGDNKMKPLNISNPQFIDSPFHPAYCELVEPYFISQCDFMIGTPSGPLGLALYFNRPVIYTNTTLESITCLLLHKQTLLLFKKYHSNLLGRCLCYEEILHSPVADFFRTRLYAETGVSLLENSPLEILQSTKEMVARLNNNCWHLEPDTERRVRELHARADRFRQESIPKEAIPYLPFYSLHQSAAMISHEYLKLNPWFLGHNWPEVIKWGWEPELYQRNSL